MDIVNENDRDAAQAAQYAEARTRIMSATTLIGERVRNEEGFNLGKIEDLMIDLETGRVAYVVLSFGGFLGIHTKLFAVPIEIMKFDLASKEFVLNLDKDVFKNAPGFDKTNWPDFANADWENEIYSYYGKNPSWKGLEPPRH
jgi:sporulation protein YlmC with PRC-barrel domain